MITRRMFVTAGATGAAALAAGGLAACTDGGSSGSADTFTWWDPYPQHDENSDWAQRVQAAGEAAGVKIERTAYDTTALTNQALLAAQEGTSPDIILLDNPAVPTLADTGMLSTTEELGLDISHIDENLLGAGQIDDSTYGIPVGANTLALFYNLEILEEAGVDPETITDWASLDDALDAISGTDNRGITFAGINTEEGTFQFLPWFWGAGAELTDLASEEAVAALELWKSWVDKGYAPNTVITNSQNTTWEEFLTGDYGFAENGTWQVNSAAEAPFETGVIELPSRDGGVAPAPTGGEFIVAPVQSDTDRYETTRTIIEAMTTPEGFVETATTFAYYIPPTSEGQEQLLEEEPELETWVSAVQSAKGRTGDNLGVDYAKISEQLWTAVQNALSGAADPADALATAHEAAAEALGG
ncbi:ABC-type sugar transport system, periplasmic component [Brachybacterium faecium DSM 4810]|uniref:ABC-type sugar transport system, periplasmic component n=1 Tax=Brachybacterium faecium (strain ATCC 43885 / DSM 4810 / JCM 11609 / LMG 19847 / NBRC 14762 / NCIMB 9860 / 6-10) TaxID=446465 RepID=C7MFU2_BRAFD|nr:extracellular solute-binding protein [Brachybacterium faecium]ACU84060.1 ABC-type sugar transport system, periplasmic component [Brachybacterium faecium DSM 4810]